MKTDIIGKTSVGLPILSYRFNNSGLRVLILGGVHGDEIEGVIASKALLQFFMQSFPYNLDLTVIPELNLEGVLMKTRGNLRGIDLNRNLPTADFTSEFTNPRYNPGPSANSENENQALTRFIETQKPQFIVSLHSWHPMFNINGDCEVEALKLQEWTGYRIDKDMGYPTPGCLGTYAGLERKIPTITYEIERGLSAEQIIKIHVPALQEMCKVLERRTS